MTMSDSVFGNTGGSDHLF